MQQFPPEYTMLRPSSTPTAAGVGEKYSFPPALPFLLERDSEEKKLFVVESLTTSHRNRVSISGHEEEKAALRVDVVVAVGKKSSGRNVRRCEAHNKVWTFCGPCGGSQVCHHGKRKSRCVPCGGSQICPHLKLKSQCVSCGGSQICPHKRQRAKCKDCGGSHICQHNRQKDYCKLCKGKQICEHMKHKAYCKLCKEARAAAVAVEPEASSSSSSSSASSSTLTTSTLPTSRRFSLPALSPASSSTSSPYTTSTEFIDQGVQIIKREGENNTCKHGKKQWKTCVSCLAG